MPPVLTDDTYTAPFGTAVVRFGNGLLPPLVTQHPSNLTVTEPAPAPFTASATGGASIQWQQTTPPGSTFADVPGATAGTYTISPTEDTADNGRQVRARFTNGAGTVTSNAATLTVNAAAAPPPPADWAARSTATGVVWAHRFEYDGEVTQHLGGSSDPTTMGPAPRRVIDANGEGCLEHVMLGAVLTAPYTAGGTAMQIDDTTGWPALPSTPPLHVIVHDPVPNVAGTKNLFRVDARSGNTLTVQYVDNSSVSAFSPTPRSYAAGAYVGQEGQLQWVRTFAALPAGENGLPVDDRADAGGVPLRSKLTGNALSVPRDFSLWQYGWYAHPSVQSTWANWTPWEGATTLTPRGVSQGAAAKFRLFDGDEFYIQYRRKIDVRFFANHAQPDPSSETQWWGRKLIGLQSEISGTGQLVDGMGGSSRFGIPATTRDPFSLTTYKASRVVGVNDWARTTGISHQKGSPWDVAPHFADLRTSFLPATGAPTPDGAAAWESPDGEWVTFYWRVRPGRSGVAETQIEVKIARQDAPGYDGSYTTILSVNDARIVYSGQGDYDYPDGPFSYPGVTVMNALPGYQALWLFGYLNVAQTAALPVPRKSYSVRMGQVIFSRQPIAAPAVPIPAWVASITPGQMATYSGGGSVVTNNFRSVVSSLYDQFYSVKIVNDFSGAAANPWWGSLGCKMFKGAGHSASNDNSTMVLEYGPTTMTWRRIVDPSPWTYSGTGNPRDISAEYTSQMDYTWGEYLVDGKPMSLHSYGLLCVQDPATGGAANGTMWLPAILAGQVGSFKSGGAHRLPLNSTSATPVWARGSTTAPTISGDPAGLSAYVPAQRRVYLTFGNDAGVVRWLDTVTQAWNTGSGTGFNTAQHLYAAGEFYATMIAAPERDLLLLGRSNATGNLVIQWMSVGAAVSQPTLGGTATLSQALALETPWTSATWCPDSARLLIIGAAADLGAVYEVAIPTLPASQTWQVVRAPLGSGQTLSNTMAGSVGNVFGKWSYDSRIKACVFVPVVARADLGNDQVHVYRPRNT